MHWLTTAEGHVALLVGILANLAYVRQLHRRLNGHVKPKEDQHDQPKEDQHDQPEIR